MSIPVVILALFLVCSVIVLLGLHHSYKRYGEDIQKAEKISSAYINKEWVLIRRYLFPDFSLLLSLRDIAESECTILYQPAHPDYQKLVKLPIGSKIQFLAEKNIMSEATEPATYIKIKSLYTPHDTAFHA